MGKLNGRRCRGPEQHARHKAKAKVRLLERTLERTPEGQAVMAGLRADEERADARRSQEAAQDASRVEAAKAKETRARQDCGTLRRCLDAEVHARARAESVRPHTLVCVRTCPHPHVCPRVRPAAGQPIQGPRDAPAGGVPRGEGW